MPPWPTTGGTSCTAPLGGSEYTIAAVSLSPADWQAHFGDYFPALSAAKATYDPSNILGAGLDVFP